MDVWNDSMMTLACTLRIERRDFLRIGIAATATVAGQSCGIPEAGSLRFFSATEARIVDGICERLIPADEFGGASDAGVLHYIDLQLTGHFQRFQDIYREGIAEVDGRCRSSFHKPFAEATPEEQVEVLKATEIEQREFFELIRIHTMQGYYGDPRHGGNRNALSWRMLELPVPPVRGRLHHSASLKSLRT